jgi:UDP-glucose 4-epimerase
MKDTKWVLVTGASGFVGRRLCAYLRTQGARIRAVQRTYAEGPWDEQVCIDLGACALAPSVLAGVSSVYHLAGRAHAMSELNAHDLHQHATVRATENLLAACSDAKPQSLVFLSTTKAVADPGAQLVDESFKMPPNTPYGLAKSMAEEKVLNWGSARSTRVCVLRTPMVLGRDAKGNAMAMLRQVRAGRFPPLAEMGNRRSVLHVQDLVEGLVHVSYHACADGECFYICDPRTYSTRQLLDVMRRSCGQSIPKWSVSSAVLRTAALLGDLATVLLRRAMPFDSQRYARLAESAAFSPARLRELTGFEARHTLDDAIAEMFAVLGPLRC